MDHGAIWPKASDFVTNYPRIKKDRMIIERLAARSEIRIFIRVSFLAVCNRCYDCALQVSESPAHCSIPLSVAANGQK